MLDFSLNIYNSLLNALRKNYDFLTYEDFSVNDNLRGRICILRHDVDKLPLNSLVTAKMENKSGIKGTYYFRIIPEVFKENIIREIAELGHEIGYHYETLDTAKGNIDKAYDEFCRNLEELRRIYSVKTICMHGSPRSKYDNRDIWAKYDYKSLGLTGEPYIDVNFNEFAYFTDTGRRWNGSNVSIRDKVESRYNFNFKSTSEIITNIESIPQKVMFTIHPQRWFNPGANWLNELLKQKLKNIIKFYMVSGLKPNPLQNK